MDADEGPNRAGEPLVIPPSIIELAAGRREPRPDRGLLPVVGDHRVRWYPKTWFDDQRLAWATAEIEQLTELCGGTVVQRRRTTISRAQVFEQFRTATPMQAFLAAMIWGYGTFSWGRARLNRIHDAGGHRLAGRIADLIDTCRAGDAGRAWDAFSGLNRIDYLGPAFATKVAYFSAFADGPPDGPAPPLIADSLVDLALGEPGVTVDRSVYLAYTVAATEAATDLPTGRDRPDQVELALFNEGWHLRRKARPPRRRKNARPEPPPSAAP